MFNIEKLVGAAALSAGLTLAAGAATAQDLLSHVIDRGTLRIGVAEGPPYQ